MKMTQELTDTDRTFCSVEECFKSGLKTGAEIFRSSVIIWGSEFQTRDQRGKNSVVQTQCVVVECSVGCDNVIAFTLRNCRDLNIRKTSSAVAKRPHDASCLSAVSFNIHTAQFFNARQHTDARYWYSNYLGLSVCLSVCLYVRDVPVSDENGLIYRHRFFHHTVSQSFKFYRHQTSSRNSDEVTPCGGAKYRWV